MSRTIRSMQLRQQAADTPAAVNERKIARVAGELAIAARAVWYPVLTAENADAAIAFQAERLEYYRNKLRGGSR